MKKTLAAVALAGSLTFLGAGAAQAAPLPYPGEEVSITVPSGTVESGESVRVSGTGFTAFETVTVTVLRGDRELKQLKVKADADGNFTADVPLGKREGTYTITALGKRSGVSGSVQVYVVDDEGNGNGNGNGKGNGNGNGNGHGNGNGNGRGGD
jgi:hypothetical protein